MAGWDWRDDNNQQWQRSRDQDRWQWRGSDNSQQWHSSASDNSQQWQRKWDWRDYYTYAPDHKWFSGDSQQWDSEPEKAISDSSSSEEEEEWEPSPSRDILRGHGANDKRRKRRELERAGLPVPEWLQPNKISSLNKADQDQRRKLQKQLYKLEEDYTQTKTKKEGHEVWMKILDVKEELKELLAPHTKCPPGNRPKPPKPPPPKPRPKGLQPAKPARGQGTPAQGGEQGTLCSIQEQPEKAEEEEEKKEETENVKKETKVEPDKAESAPHRNKKRGGQMMMMMMMMMRRRERRSSSLQRLKPRKTSLKRQSLLMQTWKMRKRRSLTRQRNRKMMKPEKASHSKQPEKASHASSQQWL